MRRSVRDQLLLVPAAFDHLHVRELQSMSAILDAHPEFSKWIQADLLAGGVGADRGRDGMSGEEVLRALVIKQSNGFSYKLLAFHLADSQSYRAFCRIGFAETPPEEVHAASQLQASSPGDARTNQSRDRSPRAGARDRGWQTIAWRLDRDRDSNPPAHGFETSGRLRSRAVQVAPRGP